jgi:adenylate cyclase
MTEWIIAQGIAGAQVDQILNGFCERLVEAGISILRVNLTFRAYHPEFGALAFRWRRGAQIEREAYEHTVESPRDWVESPLYYLLAQDASDMLVRLDDPSETRNFPVFDEFRTEGVTAYYAAKITFDPSQGAAASDPDDPSPGMIISFTHDGPDGFSDRDLALMRAVMPPLGLALKSVSTYQMARDLLAAYLGSDAGRRVLSGDIVRGTVDRIEAVILYFDLSGFTKLSEALQGPDIIDLLNAYFGAVVPQVQTRGGNVLKFMGDGMLAIFAKDTVEDTEWVAVDAICAIRDAVTEVSTARRAAGRAATGCTMSAHAGAVLYGNIGAPSRLDFTVIGPAVNTAARINAMSAMVDQPIVIGANVARPLLARRPDLVSLGQYRLRGVTERQELFTLD